jgi:stress response protein YsnF
MATAPLSKLDEYELVNEDQDIRGWKVYDATGNVLGKVDEMIVDTDQERVTTIRLDNKAEYPVKDIELGDNKILLVGANRPLMVEQGGLSAQTGGAAQDELRLQVVQERLRVGKRQVDQGGVRVTTTVVNKPASGKVTLREEHIEVARNKVDRPANLTDLESFKDGAISLVERAEVPIVSKPARVVEEVVVRRAVEQRQETVHEKVRFTDIEVKKLKPGPMPSRTP